jgi:hypothetical protein
MEELQIKQIYFLPAEGNFNEYSSVTSGSTEVDTPAILNEYLKRFSEAWDELAKK